MSGALLALALVAQAESGAARQFLKSLDSDGNGWVGRDEWVGSGSTFVTLDVDLDGWLTAAELSKTAKAESAAPAAPSPDLVPVALRGLPTPYDPAFQKRCLACHDEDRILRAQKSADGWAQTVARMREKKEAAITEKEAKAIVAWLQELRARVATSVTLFGSAAPERDWAFVVGSGDLHHFDRDRDGRLDGGELGRLVHARADQDGDSLLAPGELALLPLAVDRRALFAKLDRDRNGGVSVKELGVPQPLLQLFDVNRDGQLDRDELPRSRPRGPFLLLLAGDAKAALELLDKDRDRRLSATELDRFPETLRRFDDDKDSSLDLKELETAVTAARVEGSLLAFDDFLARWDVDGDGSVARAEFAGRLALFRRLDVDGDGAVTTRDAGGAAPRTEFTPEAQRWRQ